MTVEDCENCPACNLRDYINQHIEYVRSCQCGKVHTEASLKLPKSWTYGQVEKVIRTADDSITGFELKSHSARKNLLTIFFN